MRKTVSRSHDHAYCVPLTPRAALRRVFGGMAVFVSFPLLGLGAYLIEDQFQNPVGSHPAGLLFAAVLIAAALVLLSYVIYPGGMHGAEADTEELQEEPGNERTIEVSVRLPLALPEEHADSAAHHRYVEPAHSPVAAQARGMAGK